MKKVFMKNKILYVDCDSASLKKFNSNFSKKFSLITAHTLAEAWGIVQKEKNNIAILLADQHMPIVAGRELLKKVRLAYPNIIRILITAYSCSDSCTYAFNNGDFFDFINKPWGFNEMGHLLDRNMEYFKVREERNYLIKEKIPNFNN